MSYERMEKRAAELEAEVAKWLSAAEAADAEEDKLHGRDKTGDEMPEWVADKKRRAERIRQAKAELEAEAKAAAEAKLKAAAEVEEKREAEGRRKGGRKAAPPSTEPDAKAQKNFTDPESRIMKSKDGFVQAYNAQAAVDGEAQIIVAHDVTQSGTVKGEAAAAPPEPSTAPEPADAPTRVEAMRAKIKAGGHTSPYRLRKQLPEPVFGQIKPARGFRQFLPRGFQTVRGESAIVCTVHHLLKLAHGRSLSAALPIAAGAG